MASTYPGSLDSFDTIASDKKTSDSVGGRTHRDMHNDLGDAIEAVQAELGTDPAGTFATVKARLAAYDAYAAKTGAYTATVNDNTLNVTSGTFTLDLPAANTCTGKTLKIKNSGTGVVTLDGNSSETVEGVATFPLGPGSYVEITSTGSVWILTGGVPDTGWRNVSASIIGANGWTGGTITVRRVGSTVEYRIISLTRASGGSGDVVITSAGFGTQATTFWIVYGGNTMYVTPTGTLSYVAAGATSWGSCTFTTSAAWPTSLPGSAA